MAVSIDKEKLTQLELRLAELEREITLLKTLIEAPRSVTNGEPDAGKARADFYGSVKDFPDLSFEEIKALEVKIDWDEVNPPA